MCTNSLLRLSTCPSIVAVLLLVSVPVLGATVVTYPVPSCYPTSDQLAITVNTTQVPVIAYTAIYDYCHFSSTGLITVTITASEPITTYKISPLAYHIPGKVRGNTLTFTLPKEHYLIVKINRLRELVIAGDSLEADRPASSGPGIYNITTAPYHADGTGRQYATGPVQKAIDDAAAAGGVVYVPAGIYKCGNLILQSKVAVYLEGGAVIRGSGLPADYRTFFSNDFMKMDGTWFIYTAAGASQIKLYGRGTVDGNGQFMREAHHYLNHIIVPLACSHFTMDGIIVRDSGLWGTIPTRSDHVTIRNCKLLNEVDQVTVNDALDVQESQDVLIDHVIGISQDDAFSTKTWSPSSQIARQWPGAGEALTNVVFNDCLAWSRYGAFKAGNGSGRNQTDVTFRNSYVYLCREAILIEPKFGSARYQNFTFENIDVEGFWPKRFDSRWLAIQLKAACSVNHLNITRINVRTPGSAGAILKGFDADHQLSDVTFTDITVNGTMALSLDALNLTNVNGYVSNVKYVRSKSVNHP